jgi:hypothetical protein
MSKRSINIAFGRRVTQTDTDPSSGYVNLTQVTQNAITWTFDTSYKCGQYANGDYWVVDPGSGVTITSTSHVTVTGVAAGENHDINPRFGAQSYDSRVPLYTSAVTMPKTLYAGDCIVTVTNYTTPYDPGSGTTNLYSGAVLNVVDTVQSSDKFRPPYCRPTRVSTSASDPLIYSFNSITSGMWSLLPGKSQSGVPNVPSVSSLVTMMQNIWLDHLGTSAGGQIHPYTSLKAYGAYHSSDISTIATALSLAYSSADLKTISKYLVQIGIDYYGCVLDGGVWYATGGNNDGRMFPLVFAGVMLNDSSMKTFDRWDPSNSKQPRFSDDGHYYYYDVSTLPLYQGPPPTYYSYGTPGAGRVAVRGVKGWLDIANGGSGDLALWRVSNNGDVVDCIAHEHLDISGWDPVYEDTSQAKFEAYRMIVSPSYIGQCLFMNLFRSSAMISTWGNNSFFDYCLRWMSQDNSIEQTEYLAKYSQTIGAQQTSNSTFVDYVWSQYAGGFSPLR